MKTTVVLFAGLFAFAAADSEPIQLDVIETTPTPTMTSNATTSRSSTQSEYRWACDQPYRAVPNYYRLTKAMGPYMCQSPPLSREWAMLKSYRDGGIENIHWKYTENVNDPECLNDWTYHAADGYTVKTKVSGRTTTFGLNRRWCGLPVYNDGGVQGYQWQYCDCKYLIPPNPARPLPGSIDP